MKANSNSVLGECLFSFALQKLGVDFFSSVVCSYPRLDPSTEMYRISHCKVTLGAITLLGTLVLLHLSKEMS